MREQERHSTVESPRPVNNDIYASLGERWYDAHDDPVALLRAEARHRNPWLQERMLERLGPGPHDVLDVGCGAGFLTNPLAQAGHNVSGLDAAHEALSVARAHDLTGRVDYRQGDALSMPYSDASFDVVAAMDFLEHVEQPERAIGEMARVLRPGGLFFFHTFDRNWLSWLVVIKGVEWFVKNVPPDMHVLRLFLRPGEVKAMCAGHGLVVEELVGSRPRLGLPLLRLAASGVVPPDLEFTRSGSTRLGYTGLARKTG
jgi:2-polyprenyl-6-hydroxyphenyl methylase/3-demethylubiquinone-9 3-methyltransferase